MAIQDDINNLKAKIGPTPTNPTMMPELKGVVTDKEAVTIQEALGGDMVPKPSGALTKRDLLLLEEAARTGITLDELIQGMREGKFKGIAKRVQQRLLTEDNLMRNTAQTSDMDVQMQEYNEKVNTPGTYEYMAEQLAKQLRDSMEPMSEEQLQFINARQELIDEVLMPLSDAGYQDLVYIILNRPRDSVEHNQASIQLAEVMAQMDDEFDPNEYDMMINMVSKEPAPDEMITRVGPFPPPPTGIGGLR
tara:strand:+ start:13 stop:759 length:747 start_codon:yes stop_codon:yes gene_type:complete